MSTLAYPFRFHPIFAAAALPFGVVSSTAWVRVHDDRLEVRYGPWRVGTELANVAGAVVTGPYAWPKVIGPPHVSFADRGLSFASNPDRGVCVRFHEPVRGVDPVGLVRHPSLTLTVEDAAGLAELLDRAGEDTGSHQVIDLDALVERTEDDLGALTAAELRRRARERGITGTARMSKAVLLERLRPAEPEGEGEAADAPDAPDDGAGTEPAS